MSPLAGQPADAARNGQGGALGGQFDLVVVGGGPAGSVAAWQAARDGCRVALIDPGRTPARQEGLSPRLHGWLQRSGLYDAAGMGAVRARRVSHWAGTASEANAEIIVERASMDRWLRRAAQSAGATLLTDTAVPQSGGALLSGGGIVPGRRVFDARGRRAHRDRTRALRGPATVAIGAEVGLEAAAPPGTCILPLDEGWLWFACRGGGVAWVQLTLDAADPRARSPEQRLRDGIAAAGDLLPPGLRVVGPLLVRDSAAVLPAPVSSLAVLPVGDAAAAMDPLSGHGMFWAVSSALAATAVRRTLDHAEDAASRRLAQRFLDQRNGDVYLRQARLGRDFIRAEAGRRHLTFWSRRAAFPDDQPVGGDDGTVAVALRPVVAEGRLAEAEVLLTPHSPAGVAWIGDRPAVEIYRAFRAGAGREELARRFGRAGAIFPEWLARET